MQNKQYGNTCSANLTNPFNQNASQYFGSRTMNIPVATSDSSKLIHYAKGGLDVIFKQGYEYKRASVIVTGIVPDDKIQYGMFDCLDSEKKRKLLLVRDLINEDFGQNTVRLATMGTGKKGKWKMRNEFMSPRYTTKWKDIKVIN